MEEQKKEAEQINEENMASEKKSVQAGMPRRSLMLWVLAGIYLLYTGYKLCKNVLDGVAGGGIGFMISGIVFLAIGGALLFLGAKGLFKDDKLRKEQEAAAAAEAEEPDEGAEEAMEETAPTEPKKKMTISERASLANRLAEEDTEENEE